MTGRIRGMSGVLVLALGLVGPSQAQERMESPKETPRRQAAPIPEGVEVERDLAYVAGGTSRQTLDLYRPEGAGGPLPVVVWVHGGGWQQGSKAQCPAIPLAARGYAVASINYRLTDAAQFPAQIEDCRAAIRWLRAHAATYRLDPGRIGVWGASAGGHLVALLGTSADQKGWDGVGGHSDISARVQAVCDYFGPSDFIKMAGVRGGAESAVGKLLGGPPSERRVEARKASPVAYASKDDAPFLIVHGREDPLVPMQQSEALLAALTEAGVDAALLKVKNGKHGAFGPECEPSPEEIRATVFGFFDKHLKKDGNGGSSGGADK